MSLEIQTDKIFTKSYNYNFLVLDKEANEEWVGKINKRLEDTCTKGNPDIYDLNERALLAFDLARLVSANLPETKQVRVGSISNRNILEQINKAEFYNFDNIILTRYIRGVVISQLKDVSTIPLSSVLPLFVFDSWIGNLDKKEDDYILDNKNRLWSIDYQLWGPRDPEAKRVLGFCAEVYDLTEQNIVEQLTRTARLKDLLKNFNDSNELEECIRRIENVSDKSIENIVKKYNFCGTQENLKNNLNATLTNFLIESRDQIRSKVWNVLQLIKQ
jgi:hypothetical protein